MTYAIPLLFCGATKALGKNTFTNAVWVNTGKWKEQNSESIHFKITTYKVFHGKSNTTASFAEYLIFK